MATAQRYCARARSDTKPRQTPPISTRPRPPTTVRRIANLLSCDIARYYSRPQRVQHRRSRDLEGAVRRVAQAVRRLVAFQGTADVVLAVEDRPAAVDLDALEERRRLAHRAAGLAPALDVGVRQGDAVQVLTEQV